MGVILNYDGKDLCFYLQGMTAKSMSDIFCFCCVVKRFWIYFWFFSTRSKMMGRTFKCMFFIQRDWLFLWRVKRECKDQSPSLLFRKNLAFRRFFYCNSYSSLASFIDFKCRQLCRSFGFVASFKFSHAHTKIFSPIIFKYKFKQLATYI